jgi:hypothetical protein
MRKAVFFLNASVTFFFGLSSLYSQNITPQVINTTGGAATIGDVKFEWSVGEMPIVSTMQNVIVITNGFLQPIIAVPGENSGSNFGVDEIRVFPNPTSSFVDVKVLTKQKGTISLRLYNSTGQLVFQNQFAGNGVSHTERIEMQSLSATEYFLQIVLDPAPGSTSKKGGYKIIKIN